MDHFSPSYFALLGPMDQAQIAERIIPEPYARILGALSAADVRYLLAGDMALALYGVPRVSAGLDLLIDPDETSLRCLFEALGSAGFDQGEDDGLGQFFGEGENASSCVCFSSGSGLQVRALVKTPVPLADAFERKVSISSGSLTINLLSFDDLVLVKSDSGEPADTADAEVLRKAVGKDKEPY